VGWDFFVSLSWSLKPVDTRGSSVRPPRGRAASGVGGRRGRRSRHVRAWAKRRLVGQSSPANGQFGNQRPRGLLNAPKIDNWDGPFLGAPFIPNGNWREKASRRVRHSNCARANCCLLAHSGRAGAGLFVACRRLAKRRRYWQVAASLRPWPRAKSALRNERVGRRARLHPDWARFGRRPMSGRFASSPGRQDDWFPGDELFPPQPFVVEFREATAWGSVSMGAR